jgi:hypothetical protein
MTLWWWAVKLRDSERERKSEEKNVEGKEMI